MSEKKPRKPRTLKYGEELVRINELLPISAEKAVREVIKFARESKIKTEK
jgi:hypothetical protein